ncbi:hypothetical protein BpHYR1_024361 [Brachionus plicatilis]|uniref:Uncharacterized protein n=1 Tax=Brachionus plicatilis TaxID=10195 RepID=A0A3M7P5U7_BRAPC|nr:hypothetical protein BpHYR1_024361 [Brachionus plicatilis]
MTNYSKKKTNKIEYKDVIASFQRWRKLREKYFFSFTEENDFMFLFAIQLNKKKLMGKNN